MAMHWFLPLLFVPCLMVVGRVLYLWWWLGYSITPRLIMSRGNALLFGLSFSFMCFALFQWGFSVWYVRIFSPHAPSEPTKRPHMQPSSVLQTPQTTMPLEPMLYEAELAIKQPRWNAEDVLSLFEQEPSCGTYQVIILVMSPPYNFERRDGIRKTWGSPKKANTTSWRTLFVVGESETDAMDLLLSNEQQRHMDLIRADMTDSYRNLTIKVMLGMSVASRLCHFKYLLKTDDDCYVNARVMTDYLVNVNTHTRQLYAGRLQKNTNVIRDSKSKWSVEEAAYGFSQYPPYISGAGYILSQDVVSRLVSVYKRVLPLPNEDTYMGVLMAKLGVAPLPSGRFSLVLYNLQPCSLRYMFVIHGVKPQQQAQLHMAAEDKSLACQDDDDMLLW